MARDLATRCMKRLSLDDAMEKEGVPGPFAF